MAKDKTPTTTDRLRHEIDSGETGEKADWPDPAAAPLGTDAEASGNPPSPEEIHKATPKTNIRTPLGTSWGAAFVYIALVTVLLVIGVAIVVSASGTAPA